MKVLMFALPLCPYCKRAEKIIKKLKGSEPRYSEIDFEKVNEMTYDTKGKVYDYYYVPTFFAGDKKMYEASPDDTEDIMEAKIRDMMDALVEMQ